ncbi:putative transmembrane domain-containing protein [Cryptosporidium canis]|nr:putative transmembrane domain-containing protein [Cryptosporidium canis]
MGSSISKDKEYSIPRNLLKFIEPFLIEKNIGANLPLLNEFREPIITPIKDDSIIDQFVLENISARLFINNETSGNLRSLSLLFADLLLEREKELQISIETKKKLRVDDQICKINNIIGLGKIIKFIIIHYMKNFGLDTLIKSIEHTQLIKFIEETKNQVNNNGEIKRYAILDNKHYFESEISNYWFHIFLYVFKSSELARNDMNLTLSESMSVIERFFSNIPSFLVCSQKYIEHTNSHTEINNLLIEFQNTLMDILLILFLPNNENELDVSNEDHYVLLACFQAYSSVNSTKNIYCEDELDSFQNSKYMFLQFLIKKAINYNQTNELLEVNKKKTILLLSTILFIPPGLKYNIYSEWINNFFDPRFVPENIILSDSNTDSDIDTNPSDLAKFPYFEQAYRSVVFNGMLMNYHLSIFLLYSLVHSNTHFVSYCFSRADPDALLLAILEPVYIMSKNIDKAHLCSITALLSIILRLTSDPNLCKALNNAKIDDLPFWFEGGSLQKVIYKCDIKKNEFETSQKHSISIGNILLIVLLRTMFYNYKSSCDIYLCNMTSSIIENISINMQNFHWNVAEKLVHYIIFLSSQIYCSLNTYNSDKSNPVSFNRFYCGILMHKSLLKLIAESVKDENLLSNSELIYIIIKFSLINEIKKLHILLKKCMDNYRAIDSKIKNGDNSCTISTAKIIQSIISLHELIYKVSRSFENEIINMDNISETENIHAIFQSINNVILSKRYSSQISNSPTTHWTFRRNILSEFEFYIRTIHFEKSKL